MSSVAISAEIHPRTPRVWMASPAFDLGFFIASALVVFPAWYASEKLHIKAYWILAAVGIVANGPHLISTWTRVYLDGNERWKRPVAYWVIPAFLSAFVISAVMIQSRKSAVLLTVVFYWAFWHFVSQNWGILRIWQRRAQEAGSPIATLERVILWLGALAPMASRLHTGPWVLFGAQVFHPTVDAWVARVLFAALAASVLLYLALRIAQRRFDVRALFLAASFVAFYVPFVMMRRSGSSAFATAACWHGLQYVGIVWLYNKSRWTGGVDAKARLVSWISQPGRASIYYVSLLAGAGIVYVLLNVAALLVLDVRTVGVMTWTSLTLGHYWLDGVIWKLRKPELAKHLVN